MRLLAVMTALLAVGGCSTSGGPSMTTYGYAFPPPAFEAFCRDNGSLCGTTKGPKIVSLTPRLKAELEHVNTQVNRGVTQRNDAPGGLGDRWQVARTSGDCEDIAIRKKSELLKRGWPASALLLTVARPRFGDMGHTMLTVRTTEGDLILDSLNSWIRPWSATGYRFFARQSQTNPEEWVQIR